MVCFGILVRFVQGFEASKDYLPLFFVTCMQGIIMFTANGYFR